MPRAKRASHPENHPLFVELEGFEGSELCYSPEQQEKKFRFTGERVARNQEKRRAIVEALGMNMPTDWICRAFHVHHRTVAIIAAQEHTAIDDLKNACGTLMLKASGLSVRYYLGKLFAGEVDAKTASIAAGIFAQNGLILTGQANIITQSVDGKDLAPEPFKRFWDRVIELNKLTDQADQVANPPSDSQSDAQAVNTQ